MNNSRQWRQWRPKGSTTRQTVVLFFWVWILVFCLFGRVEKKRFCVEGCCCSCCCVRPWSLCKLYNKRQQGRRRRKELSMVEFWFFTLLLSRSSLFLTSSVLSIYFKADVGLHGAISVDPLQEASQTKSCWFITEFFNYFGEILALSAESQISSRFSNVLPLHLRLWKVKFSSFLRADVSPKRWV